MLYFLTIFSNVPLPAVFIFLTLSRLHILLLWWLKYNKRVYSLYINNVIAIRSYLHSIMEEMQVVWKQRLNQNFSRCKLEMYYSFMWTTQGSINSWIAQKAAQTLEHRALKNSRLASMHSRPLYWWWIKNWDQRWPHTDFLNTCMFIHFTKWPVGKTF